MLGLDRLGTREGGDRGGDTCDATAPAPRQRQALYRACEELRRVVAERWRRACKPAASLDDTPANGLGALSGRPAKLDASRARHRQRKVESVEQRA
jgi:hypothetical protein